MHTNAEDENKYQRSADERDDVALKLIEDNQQKHTEKNTDRNDLRKHSSDPHFKKQVRVLYVCRAGPAIEKTQDFASEN